MGWGDVKRQCRPLHTKDDVEYATGCMKKRAYTDKVQAEKISKAMAAKHHKLFNVYPCRFCNESRTKDTIFHIGSLNEALK